MREVQERTTRTHTHTHTHRRESRERIPATFVGSESTLAALVLAGVREGVVENALSS